MRPSGVAHEHADHLEITRFSSQQLEDATSTVPHPRSTTLFRRRALRVVERDGEPAHAGRVVLADRAELEAAVPSPGSMHSFGLDDLPAQLLSQREREGRVPPGSCLARAPPRGSRL